MNSTTTQPPATGDNPSPTGLKLETEYDGSLVVNGVIVMQPCAAFTREQIAEVVRTHSSHAALVAALESVVEQDDRSGMAQSIRETDGDARTTYDEYYLGAVDSARAALKSARQ